MNSVGNPGENLFWISSVRDGMGDSDALGGLREGG